MDESIRSQLPNENYRKGWDETFGKNHASYCVHGQFDDSSPCAEFHGPMPVVVVATHCAHGSFAGPCKVCSSPSLQSIEALLSE